LPRLEDTDPASLLAGVRGTAPLPGGDAGDGRLSSLGACIAYSFAHLAGPARRLLPALSLFHGVADENVLMLFSAAEGVPSRFAGTSREQWTAVLQDAARVGLLSGVGGGMYRIHPALPGYLTAAWHGEDRDGYDQEREAAEQALCTACAAFSRWLTGQVGAGDAGFAYTLTGLHRRTLGTMLGHALDHRAWGDANGIVRALDAYWETRGLGAEADAWSDRILAVTTGPGQQPTATAEPLWLYTLSQQASRQATAGQPDQAARTYRQMLTWLQDQPATEWNRAAISVIHHQLGNTAHRRGRLDEAEDWYRRSLAIDEELGDRPGMAITFHQLGMTAQQRGRLDEADDWYRRSLAIKEELGDRPGMALTYAQVGLLSEHRDQAQQALAWNIRCVTLFGDFPSPLTGSGPTALARLTKRLGLPALEAAWLKTTDEPLPAVVRDWITSHQEQANEE
jgi:tetratricopeptide (TPR) repeat protein